MKIQQTKGGQYFISLPRQIVRAKQWKKGDDLKLHISEKGELLLKRLKSTL